MVPDSLYDAFYRLSDPHKQIRSYVYDVVRATVPKINLDDVFLVCGGCVWLGCRVMGDTLLVGKGQQQAGLHTCGKDNSSNGVRLHHNRQQQERYCQQQQL